MIASWKFVLKIMKKYLVTSSLLLGSLTSPIFAEESKSFYLSIGGGINSINEIEGDLDGAGGVSFGTDSPFQYSLGIGKEFDDWRLEFNYSATTVSNDSITVTAPGQNPVTENINPDIETDIKSYMLFGYKDFPSDSKFSTYLGAGLGFSTVEMAEANPIVGGANVPTPAIDEELFTFGLKGGVEYQVSDNTSLYAEVAYLNYAEFTVDFAAGGGDAGDAVEDAGGVGAGLGDGGDAAANAASDDSTFDFDSNNSFVVSTGIRFRF